MIPGDEFGIETARCRKASKCRAALRGGSGKVPPVLLAAAVLAAAILPGCAIAPECGPCGEVFLGRSVEGRPIRGYVIGKGPETLLLLGVIHGNEPDGAPLLEKLAARLRQRPHELEEKRVIIVPVANPDGLARKTRVNARGVDLNRNFPAENWAAGVKHGEHPSSEPETRAILKILRSNEPTRILAVHSPLHCVNYDGPAEEIARELAAVSGYPLKESIGYPTPGSLGSYAGEDLGIPTITLELPRARPTPEHVELLTEALAVFVVSGGSAGEATLSRRTPAP